MPMAVTLDDLVRLVEPGALDTAVELVLQPVDAQHLIAEGVFVVVHELLSVSSTG